LSAWDRVVRDVKTARRILLLTDYDGTLTPIVDRPEAATLPIQTREVLQSLARQRGLTVGIISGRALDDLKSMVRVHGVVYAGNHGLEIEGPGLSFIAPLADEFRPLLRLLHAVLSRGLAPVRGARVENKGLSLTVHYRQVEDDQHERVGSIFEQLVGAARSAGKVKTTRGKKVLEVRPPIQWDKGTAVGLLVERFGQDGARHKSLPVFLGDDVTDEDAFKVVEQHNGISIHVGEGDSKSVARYYLRSPHEVQQFLQRLLNAYRRHRL